MGFSLKPLHLSPSREAGAPAAEARAFVWWQWRCWVSTRPRNNECKRFDKGPEICHKQLPWKIHLWSVDKSRSFGPIQPESWSGQPEACWSNKKSLLMSTKNAFRILLQEFPGHFPYDFTETSGFWRFGMASWKSHCCDIPPSLPTFKRRIRRRAKRVLTSKSFLQRAERRCVEA